MTTNLMTRCLCSAFLVHLIALYQAGYAQPTQTELKSAVRSPAFARLLHGEYLGSSEQAMQFGLQVKSLGKGEFSARFYQGGLPGNGWYGGSSHSLTGTMQKDGQLTLRGSLYVVAIRFPYATVFDANQKRTAQLTKVTRTSHTFGQVAATGAVVLFDARSPSVSSFLDATITPEGWLNRGAETKQSFQDFFLHVEFQTPWMPESRGQSRGNSGVYLQRRYEVQILDSFGDVPINNGCAALYRTQPPAINMSFPSGIWQTYDIDFRAARFDKAQKKISPAILSVWHNGVLIHDRFRLPNKTGAGNPEGPEPGRILFQDHRDPVKYRLIWILPKTDPKQD